MPIRQVALGRCTPCTMTLGAPAALRFALAHSGVRPLRLCVHGISEVAEALLPHAPKLLYISRRRDHNDSRFGDVQVYRPAWNTSPSPVGRLTRYPRKVPYAAETSRCCIRSTWRPLISGSMRPSYPYGIWCWLAARAHAASPACECQSFSMLSHGVHDCRHCISAFQTVSDGSHLRRCPFEPSCLAPLVAQVDYADQISTLLTHLDLPNVSVLEFRSFCAALPTPSQGTLTHYTPPCPRPSVCT